MNYSTLLNQIYEFINNSEKIFFSDPDLIVEFGKNYEAYIADTEKYDRAVVAEAFDDSPFAEKPEILSNPPVSMPEHKILRLRFARFIDSKGRDIRQHGYEESNDVFFDENIYFPEYFITTEEKLKQFVIKLVDLALKDSGNPLPIVLLSEVINKMIVNYLGLGAYWNKYKFEFVDYMKLFDYLEFNPQFELNAQSEFLPLQDLLVSINNDLSQDAQNKKLYLEILRLFHKSNDKSLTLSSLTLQLNVSSETFILPKPILSKNLLSFIEKYQYRFDIKEDSIQLRELTEFTIAALKSNSISLKDFNTGSNFPGVIFIKFIGKNFPLKEASSYIDIRPIIFISVVENLFIDFTDAVFAESSELYRCLSVFFEDHDQYIEWINQNLAVTFLIEDYDYLLLNFDKLMIQFSPVFNLEKNPGNLFRTFIEDKIKEKRA